MYVCMYVYSIKKRVNTIHKKYKCEKTRRNNLQPTTTASI